MPNWDDLRYVLAVHRHGSLAAAAKAVGQNKSTVGRRLTALEEDFGVALLVRTPSGYELTRAGLQAVESAAKIERTVNELITAVGG